MHHGLFTPWSLHSSLSCLPGAPPRATAQSRTFAMWPSIWNHLPLKLLLQLLSLRASFHFSETRLSYSLRTYGLYDTTGFIGSRAFLNLRMALYKCSLQLLLRISRRAQIYTIRFKFLPL